MDLIRQLSSVSRADSEAVGSKAAALGELLRAGLAVPPGFVLNTAAYALFIQLLRGKIETRLTTDVIMDPAEIETAAGEVREWIENAPWPSELNSRVGVALGELAAESRSFAVRTSVASDDLATAFGSGVERAYLGLVGIEMVEQAAARCWGALWNSRAMYYRHRKKIPQTSVALAVLVQPMVRADAAGVMFTQDPMGERRDEIQIDSIWGLGAPLTGARVRPDRFRVSKRGWAILDRDIVQKPVRLVVRDDGRTEQQTLSANQVDSPSLTDDQVLALAELGKRIEDFFAGPQDIEWARAGDLFFVLQSRPIALRNA